MEYQPLTRQRAEEMLTPTVEDLPVEHETAREKIAGATKSAEGLLYAVLKIIEEEREWENARLMGKSLHEFMTDQQDEAHRQVNLYERYNHLYETVARIEALLAYPRAWRDVARRQAVEQERRT